MIDILQEIMFKIDEGNILITNHAKVRMFENNISTDELISGLRSGEIIETYDDDFPCPSYLLLMKLDDTPTHVVAANCGDHARIVTVYHPIEDQWENYRRRK